MCTPSPKTYFFDLWLAIATVGINGFYSILLPLSLYMNRHKSQTLCLRFDFIFFLKRQAQAMLLRLECTHESLRELIRQQPLSQRVGVGLKVLLGNFQVKVIQ